MDLAGGLSKLAPPLVRMAEEHHAIRRRPRLNRSARHTVSQVPRPREELLLQAESAYLTGASVKSIAKEVGVGHERLARLLRERGVRLRRQSPTEEEVADMQVRYAAGASLDRIGAVLGYSAGTVRSHLLAAGVSMRDPHGR